MKKIFVYSITLATIVSIATSMKFNNNIAYASNPFEEEAGRRSKYGGPEDFERCQKLATRPWDERVRQPNSETWEPKWYEIYDKMNKEIVFQIARYKVAGTTSPTPPYDYKAITSELKKGLRQITRCQALLYVTHHTDYAKYAGGMAAGAGGARKMLRGGRLYEKSMDGKILCAGAGAGTQDFDACKDLISAYDAARVSDAILSGAQKVDYGLSTQKEMKKQSEDLTGTGALKVQKKSVDKQRQIAGVKAGFYVAKAGLIWKMQAAIPESQDLFTDCRNADFASARKKINEQIVKLGTGLKKGREEHLPDLDAKIAEAANSVFNDISVDNNRLTARFCAEVINNADLLWNSVAKETAVKIMMEAGIEAAGNIAKAIMLKKQSKDIKGSISAVESYKPQNFIIPKSLLAICQKNPKDPRCPKKVPTATPSKGPGTRYYGPAATTFTFKGDKGRISSKTPSKGPGKSVPTTSPAASSVDDDIPEIEFGDKTVARGGGNAWSDGRPPAPAKAVAGGGAGGGGGGGAGGGAPPAGGGGAGGGGGGSGRPGAFSGDSGGAAPGDKGIKYTPGGGIRYAGASRPLKGKKDAPDKNPFAALFKDKGPEGEAGTEELIFRGIAGQKADEVNTDSDTDIFKTLNAQYEDSYAKEKLLVYEKVE